MKKLFRLSPRASEDITDISDALAWIKTYRKARDFNTAIMAAKELILKTNTGITYYENAERKVAVLENSNIEKIATAAKEKRKKIGNILSDLYKKLSHLENIVDQIENERLKEKIAEENRAQKIKFKLHSQEIRGALDRKDYPHALSGAKKLVSDFPHETQALQILTKVQKLYNQKKAREEKEQGTTSKLEGILQEVGGEMADNIKTKKNISLFEKLSLLIKSV